MMRFQQMPKVQDRRLVGHPALARIQTREPPNSGDVVQRILHREIRIPIPVLQQMDPQHHAQRIGLAAVSRRRIMRLDQTLQTPPRYHPRHLRQERLPARHLPLLPKPVDFSETSLHSASPLGRSES